MRKSLIEKGLPQLGVRRQAALWQVNRNRLASEVRRLVPADLDLCREIDELHLLRPYYGSRRISVHLQKRGFEIGRGRTRRLLCLMGLAAIYPKPRTSLKSPENEVYPDLLRHLEITRPNQVWGSDITYIPMRRGFAYLVAIMDWHSRAVLGWRISNTLDTDSCVQALLDARETAGCWPEMMNTDQGCQYTSLAWIRVLQEAGVRISMDGEGRWWDNVFVERLWRSLKYEYIYLREYLDLLQLEEGVGTWLAFSNHERSHQALDDRTPWSVGQGSCAVLAA